MIALNEIKLPVPMQDEKKKLMTKCAGFLHVAEAEITELEILKKSLDARKKPDLFYVYQVGVSLKRKEKEAEICRRGKAQPVQKQPYQFPVKQPLRNIREDNRPVIIGTGPAGLFCGYMLASAGFRPLLIERGYALEKRRKAVEEFWQTGKLRKNCNVQFGEGGAGTFSDGKLQTQVKDRYGRIREVLDIFIRNGAPAEIAYQSKPHIGTDLLAEVIQNMHEEMLRLGAEFLFETTFLSPEFDGTSLKGVRVVSRQREYVIPAGTCILCIGHSSRDTFLRLHEAGVRMENKPFAVGFRVQHPQQQIDRVQYGNGYESKNLPAADYKLTCQSGGRNIYSFCMCPGGYVVNAASEEKRLAINGMSYHGRDSANANSAIVVSVTQEDYGAGLFDGMYFQERIEEKAFALADGKIPVMRFGDFKSRVDKNAQNEEFRKEQAFHMENDSPADVSGAASFAPVMRGEYAYRDITGIYPAAINTAFLEGMEAFGKRIRGFDREDALLAAPESRTSSPIRMLRDEHMESSLPGVYPCGEGAGYAGGITSAAVDGIKVAEKVAMRYNSEGFTDR